MLIQKWILLTLSRNFRYAQERKCGMAFMEICDRDEKRPDVRRESADYLWLTVLRSVFKVVNTKTWSPPFETLREIVQFHASHAAMVLTAHRRKYFPARRLFLLLSFVSLWYFTSCSSPEFCDKDGCAGIIGKGILNLVNGLIW